MTEPDPTDYESAAFLGLRLRAVDQLVGAQGRDVLAQHELKTPQTCVSVLRFIALNQPTTVTSLTVSLHLSRQVILQRLKCLEELGYISSEGDTRDRRSRLISLTPAGKHEDSILSMLLVDIEAAFRELEEELGADLSKILSNARDLLSKRSLSDRITEKKNRPSNGGKVIAT